jgi:hypothetical protein
MGRMLNHALRRCRLLAAVACVALGLAACGDLAAALPPRPSPFPTLARLPSVTPVTPSPIPLPTATAVAQPTATPALPLAFVVVDANMRSGPGTGFEIVSVVSAGSSIALSGRQDDWYQVRTADGVEGWMSNLVLEVDPAVADSVPLAQP